MVKFRLICDIDYISIRDSPGFFENLRLAWRRRAAENQKFAA
jgi:hypothetical protein